MDVHYSQSAGYKIGVRSPKAPLINVGTIKKPSYVTPELCQVLPGQMASKPLNPEQQRKLATALEEHRQDTISSIGGSAKALAIGNKDVAGPVSKALL